MAGGGGGGHAKSSKCPSQCRKTPNVSEMNLLKKVHCSASHQEGVAGKSWVKLKICWMCSVVVTKITRIMWLHCNLGFSQKACSSDSRAAVLTNRPRAVIKKRDKRKWPNRAQKAQRCPTPLCEFCHAGHRGSVAPAAKGCTDDLKSAKSSRGVRRPNSEGSSMTNQRRMHRVSFGCWKRHCAPRLWGLKGWAF